MIVICWKILRWQPELISECRLTKSSIIICRVVCTDVLYLSKVLIAINAVDAWYLTQMDVQLMNLIKCCLARLIPLAQHLLGLAKTLLCLLQVQECQLDHHQPMLNFQNCLKVGMGLVSEEVFLALLGLGSQ